MRARLQKPEGYDKRMVLRKLGHATQTSVSISATDSERDKAVYFDTK